MKSLRCCVGFLIAALVLAGCNTTNTDSQPNPGTDQVKTSTKPSTSRGAIRTPVAKAASSLVLDVKSGQALHQEAADASRYPASLTKLMTLYLVFEEIKAGKLALSDPLTASAKAASRPAAKIGLKEGETLSVRAAISALIVKSANDVATMVAEHIGGDEKAFVRRMNLTARSLGMRSTRFVNPSGLPGSGQVTTARDMARLAVALRTQHRAYMSFFAKRQFTHKGKRYQSTNKLLGKVSGVNGMKTGYIRLSGYNLVASVKRGSREAIVVVLGGKSAEQRDDEVRRLIQDHL